jgi:hypothetical protein
MGPKTFSHQLSIVKLNDIFFYQHLEFFWVLGATQKHLIIKQ